MADFNQDMYRVTPRQLISMLLDIFEAGLVPFIKGSPGIGKSAIMRVVAKMLQLWMIDHRISTSETTDFSGLPGFENGKAKFKPFEEIFPLDDAEIPEGHQGWLIFLDEFTHADKRLQAASYKLLLDRMVGQRRLHSHVCIALASNLDTDRALTNLASTALQTRVITLELMLNELEFIEDVAIPQLWDHRILAYLNQNPRKLMDFRPDHNEKTYCCPRSWEFLSRLIKGKEVTNQKLAMYAGTITSGVAAEFVEFTKIYKDVINIKQIIGDPESCPIPSNLSLRWATISHMMENVSNDNFEPLAAYASRFPLDFRVLFFRSSIARNEDLRQHPAFIKSAISVAKYLNG